MADVDALDSLSRVDATIDYVANAAPEDGSRWPQYWINDVARTNMESAPHDVVIRDARPIADRLDLDREGFRWLLTRAASGTIAIRSMSRNTSRARWRSSSRT